MKNELTLRAAGLCRAFQKRPVLDHVNLGAKGGDCIAIIGKNGCGKSTLLNILSGVLKAESGTISLFVDGEEISGARMEAATGYVPQENILIRELSVYDNLLFWYGGCKAQLSRDLESPFLQKLEIKQLLKKRAGHLSIGTQKRVQLACGIARHPRLLLLDEVNAPLDILCKAQIQSFLADYAGEGNIVLMSTHDEGDFKICNRICCLRDTRLIEIRNR